MEEQLKEQDEQIEQVKEQPNIDDMLEKIKTMQLKLDEQDKMISESNKKFLSFVNDYMNVKHQEIKKEAEKIIDDNDKSWEF